MHINSQKGVADCMPQRAYAAKQHDHYLQSPPAPRHQGGHHRDPLYDHISDLAVRFRRWSRMLCARAGHGARCAGRRNAAATLCNAHFCRLLPWYTKNASCRFGRLRDRVVPENAHQRLRATRQYGATRSRQKRHNATPTQSYPARWQFSVRYSLFF